MNLESYIMFCAKVGKTGCDWLGMKKSSKRGTEKEKGEDWAW